MDDLHCRQSITPNTKRPFSALEETVFVVKKENHEPTISLISSSITSSNLLRRRSSTASLVYSKRVRPCPLLTPDASPTEVDIIMSGAPPSGSWSHSAARSGRLHTPALRNRQTPGTHATYTLGQEFMPDAFVGHVAGSSSSSLTSSLNGAVSEPTVSPPSHHARSPRNRGESLYTANDWTANPHPQQVSLGMQQHPGYPGVAGMSNLAFGTQDLSTNIHYDIPINRNPSPDSNSSESSTFCNPNAMFGGDQYSLQRNQPSLSLRHNSAGYTAASHQTHRTTSEEELLRAEVSHLRQRLGNLEAECSRSREALRNTSAGHGGLPTPPPSASFQASWKARTETRRKMFCSLNRAGNALCAWHDSRRERREFPPRNAPPGYLNCGCTHEEALFEESLARHNVGSYYPGESVRMDPALRNPLLKLLQQRYGYQDGDFERDPITGNWIDGEGAAYWEQQAHSGSSSRRRVDTERH